MNTVTIDIESTGFDALSNSVITIGCLVNDKEYLLKAKPESKEKWGTSAEEVHGISYDEAMTFPSARHTAEELLSIIPKNSIFVCHAKKIQGSFFDWRMMMGFFLKNSSIYEWRKRFMNTHDSSMNMASTLILAKEKLQLENYKLNTVAEYYEIELEHHNALSDARATNEIYKQLI